MDKRKIAIDFESVFQNIASEWRAPDRISGRPADGSLKMLSDIVGVFDVHIASPRMSNPVHGEDSIEAIKEWLGRFLTVYWEGQTAPFDAKRIARNTIDAITFHFDTHGLVLMRRDSPKSPARLYSNGSPIQRSEAAEILAEFQRCTL